MNLNAWNEANINEFRANAGKVRGQFERSALLLLHTVAAKSGLPRTNPLAYRMDQGRYIIFAS